MCCPQCSFLRYSRRADGWGKLFAVGGHAVAGVTTVECFDSLTGVWSKVASLAHRRALGLAALNGRLYAVGGLDSADNTLSSVECLNPTTGKWDETASMNTSR